MLRQPIHAVTNILEGFVSHNCLFAVSNTSSIGLPCVAILLIAARAVIMNSAAGMPFPETSAIRKAIVLRLVKKKS